MTLQDLGTSQKSAYAFQQALDRNIIMSVTDPKGIIVYANKKFCEVSQFSEAELVGKSHNIINSGFHSKAFFKDLWKTILSGNMWQGEIKNKTKSGTYYWVDTVIVPLYSDEQVIENFISLRTLITSKKEAQIALTEATFNLSHNIRNPLVNLQALLTICKAGTLNSDQETMAASMQAELEKMDKLTRKMVTDLHEYKKKIDLK